MIDDVLNYIQNPVNILLQRNPHKQFVGGIVQGIDFPLHYFLLSAAYLEALGDVHQKETVDAFIKAIGGPQFEATPKIQDTGELHLQG